MNSRERFLAALHGQTPDRTPVAHVAALTTVELQQATGCDMPDVHADPAKQAKLLAANHDVLGLDAVTFIINYFGEPAALGAQIALVDPREQPGHTDGGHHHDDRHDDGQLEKRVAAAARSDCPSTASTRTASGLRYQRCSPPRLEPHLFRS